MLRTSYNTIVAPPYGVRYRKAMPLFYLMNIIIWNTQGPKKAQLQLEVVFMERMINSDILFLTETMVNEHNTQ